MKAAVYRTHGEPSVLQLEDVPDPVATAGEVLIEVAAVSIEGGDLFSRRFVQPAHPPHIGGYQAAGTVVAVGDGVRRFAPGDRVATFGMGGAAAELRVVPEHHAWAIPDGLDFDVASTVPVTFGTADDALFDAGRLAAGETVLIQGAAGGVGLAAVQLAKAAGARVIATSSSEANLARLQALGADHGLNHRGEDLASGVQRFTGGEGVDLVLDMAGGGGFDALVRATRYRGRIVVVGAASGELASVPLMTLIANGLSVHGLLFGREMHGDRARAIIERHLASVAAGRLSMPIDRIFPLADAAAAHAHVEQGHPFGRVLLRP